MALIAAVALAANGTIADMDAIATAAAGGGDTVLHTGKEVIFINNGGGSSITVTLTSRADNFGQTLTAHDITRSVAAGKWGVIGPTEAAKFKDPATGLVNVGYSGVTSVKILVLTFAVTA